VKLCTISISANSYDVIFCSRIGLVLIASNRRCVYYIRQGVLWNCDHASLLVGRLVCSLRLSWCLINNKPDFHEICHRCSASVTNFTQLFWEVKVKVQGHNRPTENLQFVIARLPWFKTSSQIWQSKKERTDIGVLSTGAMLFTSNVLIFSRRRRPTYIVYIAYCWCVHCAWCTAQFVDGENNTHSGNAADMASCTAACIS